MQEILSVCDRGTEHIGRGDLPQFAIMAAGCFDHRAIALDDGICGGMTFLTDSASHFLPLWCQVGSQATIKELCFLFRLRSEMT